MVDPAKLNPPTANDAIFDGVGVPIGGLRPDYLDGKRLRDRSSLL
jgi:hypothetical protein